MLQEKIVFLMYHELECINRILCNTETGYKRYVIKKEDFYRQIEHLVDEGFIGLNVSEGLSFGNSNKKGIVITFDDGCETDLLIAAPILKEFNFNATFYVVAGLIGKPGYLSQNQLLELSNLGFEIGSHSMTHRFLSDLHNSDLRYEIYDSKIHLEQIIGKTIHHFSCPGGRWSKNVVRIVKESGYSSMSTSRIGTNHKKSDFYSLSRISVLRGISLDDFDNISKFERQAYRQAQETVYSLAKVFLGNTLYNKIRHQVLRITF